MTNASIVLYNNSISEIHTLVATLRAATNIANIYLIDNSPYETADYNSLDAVYIFNNKNIGYGSAHNIAIQESINNRVNYHLVVNPDIVFKSKILTEIEDFMNNNTDIGSLMPKVSYPSGNIQYLCKLIPTPFDLLFRRFLPRAWTKSRTTKFELQESGYNRIMNVPYLSGCFMFLRTEALQQVGLFDERFFMYPEDIDLTRRIHEKYRTVFYPRVQVIHYHTQGSYFSTRLLLIHMVNMIKYFNKWGWIFDKKRRKINKEIIKQLSEFRN